MGGDWRDRIETRGWTGLSVADKRVVASWPVDWVGENLGKYPGVGALNSWQVLEPCYPCFWFFLREIVNI